MLCDYCGKSKIHYNHDGCNLQMEADDEMVANIHADADPDPWAVMLLGEDPGEVPC